ncbi:MAG: hypothetical protein SFY80_14435 [Verrucomicrobiota bacterium]|nr:hypothetical protein [Verrucomicrobiota bacterium]
MPAAYLLEPGPGRLRGGRLNGVWHSSWLACSSFVPGRGHTYTSLPVGLLGVIQCVAGLTSLAATYSGLLSTGE